MIPYEKVLAPTLILQARKDNLEPNDWILPDDTLGVMLNRLPQARAIGYADQNHFTIQLTASPQRDADVKEFLAL